MSCIIYVLHTQVITDFAEWQRSGLGQDADSKVLDLKGLTSARMLAAGRQLLGMDN